MIIQWLTEEFQNYFSSSPHHRLVLFFDPAREYERLAPRLADTFDLISYGGSQLRIKYQIEMSDDDNKRWLVYLQKLSKKAPAVRRGDELLIVGNASFENLFGCGV